MVLIQSQSSSIKLNKLAISEYNSVSGVYLNVALYVELSDIFLAISVMQNNLTKMVEIDIGYLGQRLERFVYTITWFLPKVREQINNSLKFLMKYRLWIKNAFYFTTYFPLNSMHTAQVFQLTLTVISFLQRKCHPVTRCIKKIADQPCYNVIFYLRRTEHKY